MAITSREIPKYTLFEGVPWLVVYICEAVLILTGNSITVFIFWNIRKRLNRTSYLLINLAVADALVGIAITLFLWEAIAEMLERDVSRGMVTVAAMVDLIGTISSVLSMALISLVQSLNSTQFFPPLLGAEPGRAKEESRITYMRMLRTPPFFPPNRGKKKHIWKYFPDLACGAIF